MNIHDAARPFVEGFTYDPGHSDLDNEQPIHVRVTLGDWRRLHAILREPEALYIKDGWKLVPIEPTDEMKRAGANTGCFVMSDEDCRDWIWQDNAETVWEAMIAASRTPQHYSSTKE